MAADLTSNPSSETAGRLPTLRYIIVTLVVNGLFPALIYQVAQKHASQVTAIFLSLLPPILSNIVSLARNRRLDIVGSFVIVGLVAGLLLYIFGGAPRLILVRHTLVTGLIGVLFLVSLVFKKPLVFYIARPMWAGNDSEKMAQWDANYERSKSKFGLRIVTAAWGVALLLEMTLHIVLAFKLAIPLYLALSPVINTVTYSTMIVWSFWFGRRTWEREERYLQGAQAHAIP